MHLKSLFAKDHTREWSDHIQFELFIQLLNSHIKQAKSSEACGYNLVQACVHDIANIDFRRQRAASGRGSSDAPLSDRCFVLEPAAHHACAAKCRTSSRGHGH